MSDVRRRINSNQPLRPDQEDTASEITHPSFGSPAPRSSNAWTASSPADGFEVIRFDPFDSDIPERLKNQSSLRYVGSVAFNPDTGETLVIGPPGSVSRGESPFPNWQPIERALAGEARSYLEGFVAERQQGRRQAYERDQERYREQTAQIRGTDTQQQGQAEQNQNVTVVRAGDRNQENQQPAETRQVFDSDAIVNKTDPVFQDTDDTALWQRRSELMEHRMRLGTSRENRDEYRRVDQAIRTLEEALERQLVQVRRTGTYDPETLFDYPAQGHQYNPHRDGGLLITHGRYRNHQQTKEALRR